MTHFSLGELTRWQVHQRGSGVHDVEVLVEISGLAVLEPVNEDRIVCVVGRCVQPGSDVGLVMTLAFLGRLPCFRVGDLQ